MRLAYLRRWLGEKISRKELINEIEAQNAKKKDPYAGGIGKILKYDQIFYKEAFLF